MELDFLSVKGPIDTIVDSDTDRHRNSSTPTALTVSLNALKFVGSVVF